jgi:hypothetical protein
MKKGKGKGTVSADPVAKARHALGKRGPGQAPPTIGKGKKITGAVRGAGD